MKTCPKCQKSFSDGVKLCPFDRIALVEQNPATHADKPVGQKPAPPTKSGLPPASELAELEILQDGSSQLLFETQAFYHAPIQALLVFGGGVLFVVFASLTGLKARSGSAAPTMETETAITLIIAGILSLAVGLALQYIFKHYTVFDFRSGMVLRQARALGKCIWEGQLFRLDQVLSIGTTTRQAGVSAENLKMIVMGNFAKNRNKALPYDVSLVMLGKDGNIHEITAFRNGTHQANLAENRASLLARLADIPFAVSKEGEMLETVRKPGKPLALQPVSISAIAKKPENIANTVLVWAILLIVLIGGWFLLMSASGVWK